MTDDARRHLQIEAADFLHLVAVWLLAGVVTGDSALQVVALVVPLPEWRALPLLAGAVVVAVAELLDRRPTLPESLAFFLLTGAGRIALLPLRALAPGSAVAATLDAGVVLGAAWVVFADGHRRLGALLRQVLHRPPANTGK